jgi:hypothetical protein
MQDAHMKLAKGCPLLDTLGHFECRKVLLNLWVFPLKLNSPTVNASGHHVDPGKVSKTKLFTSYTSLPALYVHICFQYPQHSIPRIESGALFKPESSSSTAGLSGKALCVGLRSDVS